MCSDVVLTCFCAPTGDQVVCVGDSIPEPGEGNQTR